MFRNPVYFAACVMLFLWSFSLQAEDGNHWVEVNLRVSDGEFGESIVYFSFNDEQLTLKKARRLRPRRTAKIHITAGSYVVKWSTKKVSPTSKGEIIKHSKVVTLGIEDATVNIHVKGHEIWIDREEKEGSGFFNR